MLNNIKLCGYLVPTPVQAYCIPAVLTGHDLIAVAQTGMIDIFIFMVNDITDSVRIWKNCRVFDPCLV